MSPPGPPGCSRAGCTEWQLSVVFGADNLQLTEIYGRLHLQYRLAVLHCQGCPQALELDRSCRVQMCPAGRNCVSRGRSN